MLSVEHNDPINEKILAISEDKIEGFVREPFEAIAERSGVEIDVVMGRIAAMLRAGTIRRVRQTLLATNLADGALVAWKVGEDKIDAAFDFMFQRDPFSGHVVLRSTDTLTPMSAAVGPRRSSGWRRPVPRLPTRPRASCAMRSPPSTRHSST